MKRARETETSAEEVAIHDSFGNRCSFEWRDVTRIEAYKIDLLTTDDVCLELVVGDRSCIALEHDPGWQQLLTQLLARFPISEAWLERVLRPPFAANRAVLWDRRVQEAQTRWKACDVEALWQLSRVDFAPDGALRDMYVNEVSESEWNDMLAVARGICSDLTVTSAGQQLQQDLAKEHFTGETRATVVFRAGTIGLSGHCFDSSQIELSFAPHEVTSSDDLTNLLGFGVAVAAFLQRSALVTPENLPEVPIFRIDPNGEVQFIARGSCWRGTPTWRGSPSPRRPWRW